MIPFHENQLISLILLLSGLYLAVTVAVQNARMITELDLTIGEWILSKDRPLLHRIFEGATFLGTFNVIKFGTLAAGLVLVALRDWSGAVLLLVLVAGTTILNRYLKRIFPRIRPNYPANYLYNVDLSYPSGHTMLATAFYGMLAYLAWIHTGGSILGVILIVLLGLLIVLVGFSRVYLGFHFLTDVLGGWIAGFLFLLIAILAHSYWMTL